MFLSILIKSDLITIFNTYLCQVDKQHKTTITANNPFEAHILCMSNNLVMLNQGVCAVFFVVFFFRKKRRKKW